MNDKEKNKNKEDKTSSQASVNRGKQAIEAAKKRRRKKMRKKNQNKRGMLSNGEMKADGYEAGIHTALQDGVLSTRCCDWKKKLDLMKHSVP
jgi:hypothetical protein